MVLFLFLFLNRMEYILILWLIAFCPFFECFYTIYGGSGSIDNIYIQIRTKCMNSSIIITYYN